MYFDLCEISYIQKELHKDRKLRIIPLIVMPL